MFVHWGLYSLPGRNEWVQAIECIPKKEYENLTTQFSPNPRHEVFADTPALHILTILAL